MEVLLAALAGANLTLVSALAPASGSNVTDSDYGRNAKHCVKFEQRTEHGSTHYYMRNTCAKKITVFWCDPDKPPQRATGCRPRASDWPGRDSLGIDNPLHKGNKYYAQGVPLKPSESVQYNVEKTLRWASCFGGRFAVEWFTSNRDGTYQCHPRRDGTKSGRQQVVRQAQELLNRLGYNSGPVDGNPGRRTRAAVEKFQSDSGLTVDGKISGTLLAKLHAAIDTGQRSAQSRPAKKVPPAAGAGKSGDLWGSISFSQDAGGGYTWAMVWNSSGHERARQLALEMCRGRGGENCQDVGWFKNQCGALAVGDGNGFAGGGGRTTAEAESAALSKCRTVDNNCRIVVSRCTDTAKEIAGSASSKKEKVEKTVTNPYTAACRDLATALIEYVNSEESTGGNRPAFNAFEAATAAGAPGIAAYAKLAWNKKAFELDYNFRGYDLLARAAAEAAKICPPPTSCKELTDAASAWVAGASVYSASPKQGSDGYRAALFAEAAYRAAGLNAQAPAVVGAYESVVKAIGSGLWTAQQQREAAKTAAATSCQ